MRLISYRHDGAPGVGVMVDDDGFVALSSAAPDLPPTLRGIIELGDDGLGRAGAAADGRTPDLTLAEVELEPVIPEPNAIWALALNFATHIEETRLTTSESYPQVFLRMGASQVGHRRPLLCPDPAIAKPYDYEGELAVIIGTTGRHIAAADALRHVAGYAIYNEGSIREFQRHNRQFGLGKNFEQSGSFGPWMMTTDEFGDPRGHVLTTRLNGIDKQHASLGEMIFSVEQVIEYLSTGYALRPGDVIVMGTPGAIPPAQGTAPGERDSRRVAGRTHMQPGDLVEVEISGLGTLVNEVVADNW